MRLLIGLCLAAIVPSLLVAVLDTSVHLTRPTLSFWQSAAGWWLLGTAILAVLFFGLPAHFMLRRKDWRTWPTYVGAGFLVGCIAEIAARILPACIFVPSECIEVVRELSDLSRDPVPMLLVAYLGALGASAFWVVVRPDRRVMSKKG
jgi:MFS family permease